MISLDECPFCGGVADLKCYQKTYKGTFVMRLSNTFYVKCGVCGVETQRFSSDIYQDEDGVVQIKKNGAIDAIEAWNRRVNND